MEIKSSEVMSQIAIDFALEILDKQIQKKEIDKEIKEIKDNYKEEGCSVGTINKIISELKARNKQSETDLLEKDILTEKLEANSIIMEKISLLNG